jgi:hypothetical protein
MGLWHLAGKSSGRNGEAESDNAGQRDGPLVHPAVDFSYIFSAENQNEFLS